MRRLVPEVWPNGKELRLRGDAWDHNAVECWFLASVKGEPTSPKLRVSTKGILGHKERLRPGWAFQYGSSRTETIDSHERFGWIGISAEGRRLYARSSSLAHEPREPGEGFNAIALARMANLAELPRLPEPPTSPVPLS